MGGVGAGLRRAKSNLGDHQHHFCDTIQSNEINVRNVQRPKRSPMFSHFATNRPKRVLISVFDVVGGGDGFVVVVVVVFRCCASCFVLFVVLFVL